jgi:uncharacterized protein YjbI with pentapeptide repeats
LLTDTDCRDASLTHSELTFAVFSGALLAGADLSQAHLSSTIFARCTDLHHAVGLDTLDYLNSTCIDLITLRHCLAGLPDGFLGGAGLPPPAIDALRSMLEAEPERVG